MTSVASRDLRNHTRQVLQQVSGGATVTITVNGEPVAELTPPSRSRRDHLDRDEIQTILARQRRDAALADDLAWITAGTTADLGPVR